MSTSAGSSYGAVIKVCPSCEIKTVHQALSLAKPFDVIEVQKGEYKESRLEIMMPLTLMGIDFPVLNGEGEPILFVKSDSVHIEGIEFRNVATSYIEDKAAVRVVKSDYCTIKNNKLYDTFFAVYIENSKYTTVVDNYIKGDAKQEASSGNAVHAWYSNYATIKGNTLLNHRDGVYLEFVEHSMITKNHSEGNIRYGLHFMFSHYDTYTENVFKKNGSGVAVMFSDHVDMFNNRFEDNWGDAAYGLLLKDIKDSRLENNVFKKNTIAIQADNAMRIHISNNDFEENGWALKVMGNCMENVIEKNNFIANSFMVSTNSSYNHNSFQDNYWSDYAGYDLDKDGVGDVPYRPVSLFSYTVTNNPPTLILMRSTFIELLNSAEKVIPVITPETLVDDSPRMKMISHD
ncbi:MAG: nitrous oxide reductase family maturation protein NosD [Schleiferiaceae bacterium]|jgi:nitrous oxidase accessory protein|nr:nitrous oxide reductase family maturation protein NosD [Schleiferiaceae bacterium]